MPDSEEPVKPPPVPLEIHWGGKIFRFASEAEALKAGFHIKEKTA